MMRASFHSSVCLLLLWFGPLCFGQVIKVRIINGKNGRPMPREQVSVTLLYEKGEKLPAKYVTLQTVETDGNGIAEFSLPDPAPAHLSVGAHLTSEYWRCGCAAPALAATPEVIQKGAIEGRELWSMATPIDARAGEVIFIARPLTLLERLLYPLLKE